MNFWKFFKSETTEERIDRSMANVKERVERGLRAGISYMDLYNTEMNNLGSLEDDIVSPPFYKIKKDSYRNKQLQVLQGTMAECMSYFSNNIDDRLNEAILFRKNMIDDRDRTLDTISRMGRAEALKNMNDDGNKVGSDTNPGAFRIENSIARKFAAQRNNGSVSLKFIEENIKDDVKKALDAFEPQEVWKQQFEAGSWKEEYDDSKRQYDDLKEIINANYEGDDNRMQLKWLAIKLKLTENENSSICDVLRQKDIDGIGASGLDFMVERHPDILADVMVHKLLTKMQHNSSEIIQRLRDDIDIQSLLNPKGYIDLIAQEQALSSVTSELALLQNRLILEYRQYKNGKIQDAMKKHVSGITPRIMQELLDGKKIEEIYENEMNVMMEIRNKIVEPGANVKDKNGFRKVQMQILEGMINKYKECFGTNIDDRLHNTELFLTEMEEDGFLESLNEKRMELDEYLCKQNKNPVGTGYNPGVFYNYNIVDSYIKELNETNSKLTVKMYESNIDNRLIYEMDFSPELVLSDTVGVELSGKCNSCLTNWRTLDEIEYDYIPYGKKEKDKIREVVKSLKLDEDLKQTFPGIFNQESKAQGMTGLDFMIENKNDFLFNMLRYRMLNNYDESVLKLLREKKDIALLNLPTYMDFYARKKTLERAVNLYPLLDSELKNQYEKFKEKLIRKTIDKETIDKEIVDRINEGLSDSLNVEQIYGREMQKIDELQEDVVARGLTAVNSDQFMLDIQHLIDSVNVCSKYFSLRMDERLLAAQIFVQNVCNDNKKERYEFLSSLSDLDKKQKMEYLLKISVHDKEGKQNEPSDFQLFDKIDQKLTIYEKEDSTSFLHNEQDIDNEIILAMSKYEPKEILNLVPARRKDGFDKYFAAYEDLANMLGKPITDKGESIRKLAESIQTYRFNHSDNTFLLKKGKVKLAVGLEFMAEHHPSLLLYEMLEATLTKIDCEFLDVIDVDIFDSQNYLKPAEYMNLYARKKALSRVTEEIWQNRSQLLEEYRAFESKGKKSSLKQKNLKRKNLSEQEISELKTKTDETYKEFSKFLDGKKENENFAEGFGDAFNATCKAHFELISRNLKGKISLTDEEHALVDSHMGEIIKAMRYVRVDSNQSNTCTTKFFNAIGWSSHKLRIGKKANQNNQYPKKMFYTISPSREIKAQEMVKQLIGKGDYLGQHYSKRNDIGEGFYAWAANPDMKVDGAEETSSNTSWSDGRQKGSVQFTIALNKRAKIIDNEQVGEKMSDFKEKFPNTYASSKSYGKDEKKFQSIFLAFMGYNVNRMKAADESGGIDCYCITDPKVITMDPTIAVRVGAGRKVNMQRPVIASRELEEYLA